MHYIEAGSGPVMLFLHGEPTWSYLWRELFPPVVAAGYRCIAPDYIGFGKSDKVLDDDWYTAERHIESIRFLIDSLNLQGITLAVHDWGGPIGLRQLADMPDRFRRLFIFNTWLHHEGYEYSPGIQRWREFATRFPPADGDIPTGLITTNQLQVSEERRIAIAAAYDAPFPTRESKAGARRFPWMIPFAEPEAGNALDQQRCFEALKLWQGPSHFIFGKRDVVFTTDWMHRWAATLHQVTVDEVPGPHFPQEECPTLIASLIVRQLRGVQ
jgi:haloalkane dehalogenase